jgi:tRNA threonylcarbamoyladenosine biosynthesis protein TsaB
MALILNIDTATESASLALSSGDIILSNSKNEEIRDHASWIHNAIRQLMDTAGYSLSQLQSIAVTAGPGSYTGLRVGMATAKGLCHVLNIPLITESTLKVMAYGASKQKGYSQIQSGNGRPETGNHETVFVPMIDARRMEVFTAVYDGQLQEVMPPVALVLGPASYDGVKADRLLCFGNGSGKFQSIARPGRFEFMEIRTEADSLSKLAYQKFMNRDFADLAYAEPLYLKEFYSPAKK